MLGNSTAGTAVEVVKVVEETLVVCSVATAKVCNHNTNLHR